MTIKTFGLLMKKLCKHIFVFIYPLFFKLLVDKSNELKNKESNRSNSNKINDKKEGFLKKEEIDFTLIILIDSYKEDLLSLFSNSNVIQLIWPCL